ncbi:hypothetical protein HJC23_008530 [Cyclotella cryptica]|uniref:Uncharacterized protein n=1 Tax=Cyclotella cryptica TaxID=29204 RepID=A0ABD3QWJ9_9STRA|eukprot:CCRYP_001285-RA/>CCRYP_001285-RA protein AED:0.49 eAED:0.40 QI:0/-1/0/1/-1/1/1/0/366
MKLSRPPFCKPRIVSTSYALALISTEVFSFSSVRSTCRQTPYPTLKVSCSRDLQSTSSQWKPCAQPRFDDFASCIVGPWTPVTRSESADVDVSTVSYEVEEVMRSCGGAIQGIRELPLSLLFPESSDVDQEQRTYHNRADGGFVYTDDGSYSAGPEAWESERNTDSDDMVDSGLCMASLSFGNHRLWLSATMDSLSDARKKFEGNSDVDVVSGPTKLSNSPALELVRPSISVLKISSEQFVDTNPTEIPEITWRSMQRVRMPSHGQVWSLARAKWERTTFKSDDTGDEPTSNESSQPQASRSVIGLVQVEIISSDSCRIFGDLIDNGFNIAMLGVCMQTKCAKSTMRCYDTNGHVKAVAFLNGTIR